MTFREHTAARRTAHRLAEEWQDANPMPAGGDAYRAWKARLDARLREIEAETGYRFDG